MRRSTYASLVHVAVALGCASSGARREATSQPAAVTDFSAIVSAPDRDPVDRAMDAGRRPAETLAFLGIRAGQRVAELMAGRGYTAELLARAVGSDGAVYGQNNRFVLERFAARAWAERLAKPALANVIRLDRELEDVFPAEVTGLDLVVINLFYHDAIWFGTDRRAMNTAVLRALRPGGHYVVIDHSAQPGAGASVAKTLHRVEESLVRDEVLSAGFELVESSNFLRHPDDSRDWNALDGEKRGTTDRFALKFRRR